MRFRRNKTPQQLVDTAVRGVDRALAQFVLAAEDLEFEAAILETVAAQSDEVATEHALLAGTARSQAAHAKRRATKIRELVQ